MPEFERCLFRIIRSAKPSKIVSHHIAINKAPAAYDKFDKRMDGYTKVLIKFGEIKKAA